MKVGAVLRTIITCLKDGFSFLHQDMKMALKHNPQWPWQRGLMRFILLRHLHVGSYITLAGIICMCD